jgi:hypothetical protein
MNNSFSNTPSLCDTTQQKRHLGQYFTQENPFDTPAFLSWAERCHLKRENILEPFAGSNNLIHMLKQMGLCNQFFSTDIEPKSSEVLQHNALVNFPTGFKVCVTNPPYLAKNSATRRGLSFPETQFDDLYKYALATCLANCPYVAAIVPASLLNAQIFRDRLTTYVLLNQMMFQDTEHPVCLALFEPQAHDIEIWDRQTYLGKLSYFESFLPSPKTKNAFPIQFNHPQGSLGLIAIDDTYQASIRFCLGEEIPSQKISHSSRSITKIKLTPPISISVIQDLNNVIGQFRLNTHDIFLTPFKGIRSDGKMRRRLDFALTRLFLTHFFSREC